MRVATRSEWGMTLIELMVAMAIAGLTASMVFTMFVGQDRVLRSQRGAMDVQENGRVAMELLMRDIRNAGFLTPGGSAIRIEDDCGNADNSLSYDTGTWTIGGTNTMNGGDVLGIEEEAPDPDVSTACPNGSDRITLVTKPDLQTIGMCTARGCLTSNNGTGTVLKVPCKDPNGDGNGNCPATLEEIEKGYTPDCTHNGNYGPTYPDKTVTICNDEDPTACTTITIKAHQCYRNCPVGDGGNVKCINFILANAFAGGAWEAIGGDKNGASLTGYIFRTYQILDVDDDGSTELVYSDRIQGALVDDPTKKRPAKWVVVANNIDDLQFAWAPLGDPTAFTSKRLYNFSETCTLDNVATDAYLCLKRLIENNNKSQPSTLRISLVARSDRRDRASSDDVALHARGLLENNLPAFQPYDPAAAVSYGCTAENYETCSGNGNAQGFSRRVYSEVVGLRNLIGFTF